MKLKETRTVTLGDFTFGGSNPSLFLLSGPCAIEGRDACLSIAESLKTWADAEQVPLVFKASFDKANRTSLKGYRGPGIDEGLRILQEVKQTFGVPVVTDIHEPGQAAVVAEVADVLQIPAFLCRQTDLVLAAGETGAVVNVKKAQFLGAADMASVVEKVESTGNRNILLTERGNSFGYNNLVVDMRNLLWMREFGYPVVYDATHSVQRPGGGAGFTTGDGELAPYLARAATALGIDGLFIETHLRVEEALSDRANLIPFSELPPLWTQVKALHEIAHA